MPALSWANPDQKVFLESRAVAFAKAQNEKTLTQFWVEVNRDFFVHWPTPESERVQNGLDPAWDGSRPASKKKKKAGNSSNDVVVDIGLDVWVGARKEVCPKNVLFILDHDHAF